MKLWDQIIVLYHSQLKDRDSNAENNHRKRLDQSLYRYCIKRFWRLDSAYQFSVLLILHIKEVSTLTLGHIHTLFYHQIHSDCIGIAKAFCGQF